MSDLVLHAHAVADHAGHLGQADADLVLEQLAHAAHAAVAEVVDVVELDREVVVEEGWAPRRFQSVIASAKSRQGEAVLLEALLGSVDVVVGVLLVQVDDREARRAPPVDLLGVLLRRRSCTRARPSYCAPRWAWPWSSARLRRSAVTPQFSAMRCCIAAMTSSRHSVRRVNDGSAKCLCLRLSGRSITSRRVGELPEDSGGA